MNESQGSPGIGRLEKKPILSRALRDAAEMQSGAVRFFGRLARRSQQASVRKLLYDFMRLEQLLSLQVDELVSEFGGVVESEEPTPGVACIKTAPEWLDTMVLTVEQAMAIALDCSRRAFHHHTSMTLVFEGRAGDIFLELAQADDQRASVLDGALQDRLRVLGSTHPVERVLMEIEQSVRRAADGYAALARQTQWARTYDFLLGMVDVCVLHAESIRAFMKSPVENAKQPLYGGLDVITPVMKGKMHAFDFADAMQMAMNAQRRGALVHGMLARAYEGQESKRLLEIADAERRHADTIAEVLRQMLPDGSVRPGPPLGRGPRESWTCPAIPCGLDDVES